MKVNAIESAANSLLKRVRSLHKRAHREDLGQFILEGPRVVEEALDKGVAVEDVIVSQSFWKKGISLKLDRTLNAVNVVDDKIFQNLVTTSEPCHIVAVARQSRFSLDDCLSGNDSLVVVLDAVQDPGNLGTIVRSSVAFGASGIILSKGTVDAHNPKVVRSAMGALFDIPITGQIEIETVIKELKRRKLAVIALEPSAVKPFWQAELNRPLALIFGNEGAGLSKASREHADDLVTIPIKESTESLNVAMASAIVLYECARARVAS